MPKNILIFSDGTGQVGGLRPDQRLSNVYKMYRATRTGPNSPIDPAEQIAFYDPGLGSTELAGGWWSQPLTAIRKLLSSGFGTGFTRNVADCYEMILKVYEPGDHIYLFGFSRGAYTVRSVAGVMNLCGVPVKDRDGNPIPRYGKALRAIAEEAVHTVYEHGAGHPRAKFEDEREEQARRFRVAYNTEDDPKNNERGNVVPYFVGVFDTVAALGAAGVKKWAIRAMAIAGAGAISGLAGLFISSLLGYPFTDAFAGAVALLVIFGAIYAYKARIKVIKDFPVPGVDSYHRSGWRFKHYDMFLDPRIRYARHAQAIDELRASFARVGWGRTSDMNNQPGDWLVQNWFAGNHSDIGGSYPETESRLSDIALKWMIEEATNIPHPIILDKNKLHLFPDPGGMQHCEVKAVLDMYPRWIPKCLRHSWNVEVRTFVTADSCHPTVFERFALPQVQHFASPEPYQPKALCEEPSLRKYYK